jgi:hypothetical protein
LRQRLYPIVGFCRAAIICLRVQVRGRSLHKNSRKCYDDDDRNAQQSPTTNEAACFHAFTLS